MAPQECGGPEADDEASDTSEHETSHCSRAPRLAGVAGTGLRHTSSGGEKFSSPDLTARTARSVPPEEETVVRGEPEESGVGT